MVAPSLNGVGGGVASTSATGDVVVWESKYDYSRWRPYEPHVSDRIEDEYTALVVAANPSASGNDVLHLDGVDPNLHPNTVVNLSTMTQHGGVVHAVGSVAFLSGKYNPCI